MTLLRWLAIRSCQSPVRAMTLTLRIFADNQYQWTRGRLLGSVLGTCKLLGVDPYDYLVWLLPKLASGTNKTTASGLLPHDFARLKAEETEAPEFH